ncbi:hypothetical protein NECAME_11831, partial [Necator americanus]
MLEPLVRPISSVPYLHYYVEALLIATIVYLYINRKKSATSHEHKLTEKQKDELIAEWSPEPLVPDTPQDHPVLNP